MSLLSAYLSYLDSGQYAEWLLRAYPISILPRKSPGAKRKRYALNYNAKSEHWQPEYRRKCLENIAKFLNFAEKALPKAVSGAARLASKAGSAFSQVSSSQALRIFAKAQMHDFGQKNPIIKKTAANRETRLTAVFPAQKANQRTYDAYI
jgi:hypothetical protein